MSAGIGQVPPGQTFIDVGQGARINPSLYDQSLPRDPRTARRPGRPADPAARSGSGAAARCGAPADLVPGPARVDVGAAGVPVHAGPWRARRRDGRRRARARGAGPLPGPSCPRRQRRCGPGLARLAAFVPALRGDDLLIAIEPPPPGGDRELGDRRGGHRHATERSTSDSTRMRGYVLSTDLAPTILERLGVAVPTQMSGEPIEAEGAADAASCKRLEDRLAVIGPRRGPVIGTSLLIWVGLAALAGIAFGPRACARRLPLLAVAVAYLPGRAAAHGGAPARRARRAPDRRDRPAGAGARHLAARAWHSGRWRSPARPPSPATRST